MPRKNKADDIAYGARRRKTPEWKEMNRLYQQRFQDRKRYISWMMKLFIEDIIT